MNKKMSLKQFIRGANNAPEMKTAKRKSPEKLLLSANGKLDRRSQQWSRVLLYLDPEVEDKMEMYCAGTKQAILTYLINRGLNELIDDDKLVQYEL